MTPTFSGDHGGLGDEPLSHLEGTRLSGKVAIITGAASSGPGTGTGQAMSRLFARQGAQVVLVNRDARHGHELLETIRGDGGAGIAIAADVTKPADCRRVVTSALTELGRLDILVNNVGANEPGAVTDVTLEAWNRALEVNLTSAMLMCRHAVPPMTAGGGGSIVNIGTMSSLRPRAASAIAYNTAKGGLSAMTLSLAAAHGRAQIRANAVLPGPIDTPQAAAGRTPAARAARRDASPLGTEGTAWDVAAAALFLASDEARWITGVLLPVDGGIYSSVNFGP